MSRTLLVAGTASHVGKSTIAAGLCRLLADRGVSVAPFKGQNMSNNARVVVRAEGASDETASRPVETQQGQQSQQGQREQQPQQRQQPQREQQGQQGQGGTQAQRDQWGEIGVSQFVQARAARMTPTTDCNPVLLKPRGDGESQLVVQGVAHEHVPAGTYYDDYWEDARAAAERSYRRLASEHEVVIAEGAGSIGEINLHDRDLANVETAQFADADILLLVDIERGGAFASLYGTIELLPDSLRERVVGAVITKFRGDPSLLEPGIEEIEAKTGVPILGVVPYDDPGLPEEDSVGLPATDERGLLGDDDGVPADRRLRVAVPRLPRISNATDLEALADEPGVSVAFVPLEERAVEDELADADAVVLPGSKNTVDDLHRLHDVEFGVALERFDGPIVGLCGGYQMLGERITNASLEGTGTADVVDGFGLLPVETEFEAGKHLEQTALTVDGDGSRLLDGVDGPALGYEIHAGRTRVTAPVGQPIGDSSAAQGSVLGTYLHGLFDNESVRSAFLSAVAEDAGIDRQMRMAADDESGGDSAGTNGSTPYGQAATLVEEHIDLEALGEPFDR
ncbi:adenosylcobyric acid synthase (glutamine-hydrolysing) [Natronorubrum sediminis]|uniref:Probable cobyric acid synthase n=1 Tax=Natronorubrum sediminis TaxID=640943 RepID=A0A1H6G7B9_9EURY|nr:cobyric acid synthase [Natronorubrum sediminis]SEH17884.1 adenosylcobyric acid synthase (glutamine-hydrolysing) [Natronorubrum sediminis]